MKRYRITGWDGGIEQEEWPNGEWVRYEDAAAEMKALKEQINRMKNCWNCKKYDECYDLSTGPLPCDEKIEQWEADI